jgi:hypothetical protein
MADADQSSASAAPAMSSEGAAKKLESELVEVNAKILSIEASIARVESMLGGMPADQQIAFADSMGLAAKEISRAELFKSASRLQEKIDELRLPPASREPTGASSLPHCRILCFPARYTPSAGVVLPHRLPAAAFYPLAPALRSLVCRLQQLPLSLAFMQLFCESAWPPSVWQLLLYLACPHWPPLAHRVCFYPPWRRA